MINLSPQIGEQQLMKTAYFDCFAGAAGDMILGALMDAGLDSEWLKKELEKLGLSHYDLRSEKVLRKGIGGTLAVVHVDEARHSHHHRHLSHIRDIIGKSDLNDAVRQKTMEVFTRLAEAEAKVHRTDIENIHFHEIGAMDTIIDVAGAILGLEKLGIEKIFCSPLHVGSGTVTCAHGILPVPAPATAELVRGKPVYSTDVEGELLTPTAAAILTTLAHNFGPMPPMTVENIGYGAGTSDFSIPNMLRVLIGETRDDPAESCEIEDVAVIETGIDDMNPQIYDYVIMKILEMGAMDIFLTEIQMKKNRPGTLVTVICPLERVGEFADFLIRETTSIGLRWRREHRIKARRRTEAFRTKYGLIKIKTAQMGGDIVNVSPEYDDCRRIALEKKIPLKQIMEEVRAEILEKQEQGELKIPEVLRNSEGCGYFRTTQYLNDINILS